MARKQTSVEEVRKKKKKLTEELGEEQVAELEAAEAPELTPEQRKRAAELKEETGQEFIGRREKLAQKLGISSEEAFKILSEQEQQLTEGFGTRETEAAAVEFLRQRKAKEEELAKQPLPNIEETPEERTNRLLKAQGERPFDERIKFFPEAFGAVIRESVRPAVNFLDFARTSISGKLSLKHVAAQGQFNQAMIGLNENLAAVKAGTKSRFEARIDMRLARNAISILERLEKTQSIGAGNLRYYTTDGKEILTDIITFKELLDEMELELIRADVEARQTALRGIIRGENVRT